MADKILENNQVSIVGEIISDFQYSHEVYGLSLIHILNLQEISNQLRTCHKLAIPWSAIVSFLI